MQTWTLCHVQRMDPTQGPSRGPRVRSVTRALHKVHHMGLSKGPSNSAYANPPVVGFLACMQTRTLLCYVQRMGPTQGQSHGPCLRSVTRALHKAHHMGRAKSPANGACVNSAIIDFLD
eukprot:6212634-Pleurochrysis_carterae.AAC.1